MTSRHFPRQHHRISKRIAQPQRHKKGLSAAGKGCVYIFYPTQKLKTRTPDEGRPCLRPRRKVKPMSPEPSATYVSERTPVRILLNGPAHACAALDGFTPVRTRPPIGAVVKLTDLRGILQYVPQFREKTFIIAVDGGIVTDENFANILLDIALLRSLNIRVVVVHGAAEEIEAIAERQHVQTSNLDGTGVTDAPTLQLAIEAANWITHEILGGLSANDLGAATTNAIITVPLGIIHGVDYLFTGKVERVDTTLLEPMLKQGIVPVVSPIGFSAEGKAYRVNSDAVALAVAVAVSAAKLIFVTPQDGLRFNDQLIRHMVGTELQQLLQSRSGGFPSEM